jgi:hypothetical protein
LRDEVLVWDIDDRIWNIPARGIKVVNARFFVVRLEGGKTWCLNRLQLRLRPEPWHLPEEEDRMGETKVEDKDLEQRRVSIKEAKQLGYEFRKSSAHRRTSRNRCTAKPC